jgi:hypothetical protein
MNFSHTKAFSNITGSLKLKECGDRWLHYTLHQVVHHAGKRNLG